MERLADLYAELSISRTFNNLEFVGFDPYPSQHSPKTLEHNDWYYYCFGLVSSVICLYACFFNLVTLTKVLYGYKRSIPDPASAEKFFLKYDVPKIDIIKDEHYYKALDLITEWFRPHWKIHPVHFTDLRWYPWKTDTNAERPYSVDPELKKTLLERKLNGINPNAKPRFANLYTEIFEHSRRIIHNAKEGLLKHVPDNIVLHQKPALVEQGEPEKVRTVWGIPKYFVFAEAMFFWPLFSHYFTVKHTPILWNYETLEGGWNRLNTEYINRFGMNSIPMVNTDWSEFDMRVYFSMWQDLQIRVKTYFCFCGHYCPTSLVYRNPKTAPHRLHNLWNWICNGYFSMLCVSPLGRVFRRLFAGMPSGIFCTQFWDSLYNGTMIVTCLLALGYSVDRDFFIKLMGDDALFHLIELSDAAQLPAFLVKLSEESFRRFGSKLSAEKCKTSESIFSAWVLGYRNNHGFPTRDETELLARLLYPKRARDAPDLLMARCIGIAYASAGNRKIIKICEHIFNELKFKGFKANIKGLASLYDPLGIRLSPEDLNDFPDYVTLVARISKQSSRSQENQNRYWNPDHFPLPSGQVYDCPEA
nr:MAG: putative RNA-dependent RNA polymerase [Partitiviridae sp.]